MTASPRTPLREEPARNARGRRRRRRSGLEPPDLEGAVLGVLLATGFALRFAGLGEFGLNPDEAQYVWYAAADGLREVWRLAAGSPHPPANFFMLHGILKLSWDPFWLRFPSLLSGTFLIWITHRFTRHLFGPVAALGAAVIVTFSPGLIELSRVCRNYAPGLALLLVALTFFVRFLRRERWRDFLAFGLFAPLACTWYYGFVVVFAALDLVLVQFLISRRRPIRWWLRAAALQMPLAALLLFLYFAQVGTLADGFWTLHHRIYRDMLQVSPWSWLRPLVDPWRYLLSTPAATLCFCLGLLAPIDLAIRRRTLELLVCCLPLLLAYALMLAGVLPLGSSRHSAYLFPFLFALAASQVPEILDGYRRARTRLPLRLRGPSAEATDGPPGRDVRRRPSAPTVAVVVIGLAMLVQGALTVYRSPERWTPPSGQRPPGVSPARYRQQNVDRAFDLLEERVGENDLVLLSFQGLMALRIHFRVAPLVDVTPEARARGDIRIATLFMVPLREVRNGVRYFWSPEMGLAAHPRGLLRGLDDIRARCGIDPPDRVWTFRGAWEPPMATQLAELGVEARGDAEITEASQGILFAIDVPELEQVRAAEAPLPARRRMSDAVRAARQRRGTSP